MHIDNEHQRSSVLQTGVKSLGYEVHLWASEHLADNVCHVRCRESPQRFGTDVAELRLKLSAMAENSSGASTAVCEKQESGCAWQVSLLIPQQERTCGPIVSTVSLRSYSIFRT